MERFPASGRAIRYESSCRITAEQTVRCMQRGSIMAGEVTEPEMAGMCYKRSLVRQIDRNGSGARIIKGQRVAANERVHQRAAALNRQSRGSCVRTPTARESRNTPVDNRFTHGRDVVRDAEVASDGSGLARRIFTLQHWSVRPCVRPFCAAPFLSAHSVSPFLS